MKKPRIRHELGVREEVTGPARQGRGAREKATWQVCGQPCSSQPRRASWPREGFGSAAKRGYWQVLIRAAAK